MDLFLERSWDGSIWELPVFVERRRSPQEGSVSPNHVKNNKILRFSISSFKPSRFNGERIQLIIILNTIHGPDVLTNLLTLGILGWMQAAGLG